MNLIQTGIVTSQSEDENVESENRCESMKHNSIGNDKGSCGFKVIGYDNRE